MANFGLPIDLEFEVLSRLPTKDLLRLGCVCRRWSELISDSFFRRVQSRRRENLSGFLLQLEYQLSSDDIRTIAYIPVKVQGAGFDQPIFNFLPEDVELRASCNGLICCRSSYSSQDPCLYIFNPLNREWIRINCTKPAMNGRIGLAFDACRDITNSSTNFKLVNVQQVETGPENPHLKFHIYSSDSGSWMISEKICHPGGYIYGNNAIFVEGRLHWLACSGKIVAYDIQNDQPWLIPVPVLPQDDNDDGVDEMLYEGGIGESDMQRDESWLTPVPNFPEDDDDEMLYDDYAEMLYDDDDEMLYAGCIGESDGKLHYILASDKRLFIWSLEDFAEVNWNRKFSRSVEEIVEQNTFLFPGDYYLWRVKPLAFKDGYLLMKSRFTIYLYEIETNKMHEVFSASDLPHNTDDSSMIALALPYFLSLVPLN